MRFRNEVREKRVCRRKHHHSVNYSPDPKKIISSSSTSEIASNKRHAPIQEEDKSRTKCDKGSHSKRRTFCPKRKHRHVRKKAVKKVIPKDVEKRNEAIRTIDEADSQNNSLLKKIKTMLSINTSPKVGEDVQTSENSHQKDTITLLNVDNKDDNKTVDTNLQVLAGVRNTDENDSEIEILPIEGKAQPLLITIDDSDNELQTVSDVTQKSETLEKNETFENPEVLESNAEAIQVVQNSENLESNSNSSQNLETLKPKDVESSKDKSNSDDDEKEKEEEDLIQLRQLALQSNRRNKELPKPTVDEEMQLRLAALKSAVIKKCERRKQRGVKTGSSKNDVMESSSPLSLDCSDTNSDNEKSNGNKNSKANNILPSISEPDEITTLVDMELSHTDDEREADTGIPLENIPLPENGTVHVNPNKYNIENSVNCEKQLENVKEMENTKEEQTIQWDPSVVPYKNTEEIDFTADNYLLPEMYNANVALPYTDSAQTVPTPFVHQQLFQESYPNKNEFTSVTFNSDAIPMPCGQSNFTSFEIPPSNPDHNGIIPVTSSEHFGASTEIQNIKNNYMMTNSLDSFSVSATTIIQQQFHTNSEWDSAVERSDEYSGEENIEQVMMPQDPAMAGDGNISSFQTEVQISKDKVNFSNPDLNISLNSPVHSIQERTFLQENKDMPKNDDTFIQNSESYKNPSHVHSELPNPTDERTSDITQDTEEDDEEVLRANLLKAMSKVSDKNSKSGDNLQNNKVINQQNLTTINKVQNVDAPLSSDISNAPLPVSANRNVKLHKEINSNQHDHPIKIQPKLMSEMTVNNPGTSNFKRKQISPKVPNTEKVLKFSKFPQKFASKSSQHYEKPQATASSTKYWEKKKQTLIKINENAKEVKLVRSNKVQNIQQTVQCKPVGSVSFGNVKNKSTTLQVTVPTSNVSNDNCKRKVAESDGSSRGAQPLHRFVINLGEDSDSGEDNENTIPPKRRCIMDTNSLTVSTRVNSPMQCNDSSPAAKNEVPTTDVNVMDDFEKSVDVFLKQARMSQEAKMKPDQNKSFVNKNTADKSTRTYVSSITPQ
ncbi:hypothetical protein L9F63_012006, partial [Diploptera punctata]